MPPRWILIRDIILFFGGLSGIAYQLLAAKTVEPTLTVVFSAMMGLPAALWGDAKRKADELTGGGDGGAEPPPPGPATPPSGPQAPPPGPATAKGGNGG